MAKKTARKVTFSAIPWVWFEIRGEPDPASPGWYEDGGLVSKLLKWMSKNRIDWRSQRAGGGSWVGRIPPEDAPKVAEWLTKHAAQEVFYGRHP